MILRDPKEPKEPVPDTAGDSGSGSAHHSKRPVTPEQAAKDTTKNPTFTGSPAVPVPDIEAETRPPTWLMNSLVCDQNKEDFVYVKENPGGYNGLVWRGVCLKCGWQTYQMTKADAISYVLNYHVTIHIKEGSRPGPPPLIGPIAETQAPSGIPYGPQYGQVSAGGKPEAGAKAPPQTKPPVTQ